MSNATDRIASSKARYALALARLRREEPELALLSLFGSLEEALRAHLQLHGDRAAEATWAEMLATLRAERVVAGVGPTTLTHEEANLLERLRTLQQRIAAGENVALTAASLFEHQRFAAQLLQRYGVLVVAPETQRPPRPLRRSVTPEPDEERKPGLAARYPSLLLPALAIALIFLAGAGVAVWLNYTQPATTAAPTAVIGAGPAGSTVIAGSITTLEAQTPAPPTALPDGLAIGRTAYVRGDVGGGLAVRSQPGMDGDAAVLVYVSPDTALQVVGGPVESDGYSWWRVRAASIEGWCAGEFLEAR